MYPVLLISDRYKFVIESQEEIMATFSKFKTPLHSLRQFSSRSIHHTQNNNITSREIFLYNLEIKSLSRSGNLSAACRLFDQMPSRDIVSWNSILTAYWQNSHIDESKRIFDSMPERNIISWNSMVAGCIENDRPDEAFEYFNVMPVKNIASYNVMLSGFVKFDRIDEAERLFGEMPERNVISYTAMVDGFSRRGEVERARDMFDRMPGRNSVSWAVMIGAYVQNGKFSEAEQLFRRMPEKSVMAITVMITGYFKEGEVETARTLFNGTHEKDLVLWNAMISGYGNNGHSEDALRLHIEMLASGLKPDHATLIAVLTACSSLALLEQGRQTHAIAIKSRLESNISLCNALITMYSKCGSFGSSEFIFQNVRIPDIVSWNTIIAACAQHGQYQKALAHFHGMEGSGIEPNGITFLSILSACGHAGKVDQSVDFFSTMVSRYGVSPRSEHYACLVDILSRGGKWEKALEYVRGMPDEAEASVWGSLLGACQKNANTELAELATEKLVQLNSQSSGAYVMLSNIYAAAGRWGDVTRMRSLMKERGVKKQPGYSWTEIADSVHFFLVGDASHPDIWKIYLELERMCLHMKMVTDDDDVSGSAIGYDI